MPAAIGLNLETTHRAMQRHFYRLVLEREVLASLEQNAQFLKTQQTITAVPEFSRVPLSDYLK